MQFQLSSVITAASEVEKIVTLFFTYDGVTHHIAFNHDAFATPEKTKETLIGAMGALVDGYIASKL
jgi:hypothetical protein